MPRATFTVLKVQRDAKCEIKLPGVVQLYFMYVYTGKSANNVVFVCTLPEIELGTPDCQICTILL